MFKLFYTSSENHTNFGVSKVVNSLNFELKKKKFKLYFQIKFQNFFYFFKPDIIHINGCWKIRLIFFFILAKFLWSLLQSLLME